MRPRHPRGHRGTHRLFVALTGLIGAVGIGCSGASTPIDEPQAFCDVVVNVDLSSEGYRELAEVTPSEHRVDLERFAGFLADLEALEGAEDASGRREAITSHPEYQETLQRIGTYVTEECGIGGDGELAAEGEPSAPTPQAESPGATTSTAGLTAPNDDRAAPGTDDAGSRRAEAAVPPDEVKAEMREIFGDRLWGTTNGYFAPDGSEYEGNVSELTEAEALSACEELSAFIAEHSEMEGQGVLRLTDITVDSNNEVVTNPVVVNEEIGEDDPGLCVAV